MTISTIMAMILIVCLFHQTICQISCRDPQKTAYMSFNALSKRDTITNVFIQTNQNIIKYDCIYNLSATTVYNISTLIPMFYYNQHTQVQNYLNQTTANVSLGVVTMAYSSNYSIIQNGKVMKSGYITGYTTADDSFFTKSLGSVDGTIDWFPVDVPDFSVSHNIPIWYSQPALTDNQRINFQLMLNDKVTDRKMKQKIIRSYSIYFKQLLKKHLNDEHLFQNNNFTYTYKNLSIDFITPAKSAKLINSVNKGLQCQFFLEINNYPQQCSILPNQFTVKQYGGIQQIISMKTINSTLIYAIDKNLFDVEVDQRWQVSSFQFYMGDLANAVPYAQSLPPKQPITASCKYNKDAGKATISQYDQLSLGVIIPYKCIVRNDKEDLLEIKTFATFIVMVIAQNDNLIMQITGTEAWGLTFSSINPNFKVGDQYLAEMYVKRILMGLTKTTTFGTGWNTTYRRYPSARVFPDYLLIFDGSQI